MKMFGRSIAGLIACAVCAFATLPALADGPYFGGPQDYAVPFSWQGVYVGANVGGAWSNTDWTFFNGVGSERFQQNDSAVIGGAQAGAQVQWGAFVAGLEVSYSKLTPDLSDLTTSVDFADRTRESEIDNLFTATGRLGYAMDRFLVYGKGGFASGDVGFNTSVTSTGQPTTSSSDRENGWTAGAGFEYALSNCITAGIEYDFVRLDVGDRNQFVFPGFIAPETVTNAHADVQSVVGRLNFKVW